MNGNNSKFNKFADGKREEKGRETDRLWQKYIKIPAGAYCPTDVAITLIGGLVVDKYVVDTKTCVVVI